MLNEKNCRRVAFQHNIIMGKWEDCEKKFSDHVIYFLLVHAKVSHIYFIFAHYLIFLFDAKRKTETHGRRDNNKKNYNTRKVWLEKFMRRVNR